MASIATATATQLTTELSKIFSKKADPVSTPDGQVQEVGVCVTGVVGHAQFLALVNLSTATQTHLSAKRSGAGQCYFFTPEEAK
ncbi:MAG: hypothetical protein EOO60_08160 [Hymenobacter sp.]|nr:MAG: hypothetical protein EOO60_08160 [Hymenobacter sp.]